ncbi:MAG TPA: HAD hydrolase-like protein, partial [Bdellovibrionales bacterium]|nr:HAD hydrolase-like protein [Bdellovibrionales bacterium]
QVFYVDSTRGQKKSEAFGRILLTTGLKPEQFLCIGNRLDLEIAQGKQLGFDTCLVQTGEHKELVPAAAEEHPDYKIASISEIMKICQL